MQPSRLRWSRLIALSSPPPHPSTHPSPHHPRPPTARHGARPRLGLCRVCGGCGRQGGACGKHAGEGQARPEAGEGGGEGGGGARRGPSPSGGQKRGVEGGMGRVAWGWRWVCTVCGGVCLYAGLALPPRQVVLVRGWQRRAVGKRRHPLLLGSLPACLAGRRRHATSARPARLRLFLPSCTPHTRT